MSEPASASAEERIARAKARWDLHPLHRFFDVQLEELRTGYARCRMHASENNRGGVHGVAHGGVLAFLSDVAAPAAVSSVLGPDDRAAGTAELSISYLSPAGGDVLAEAQILRKGRSLVVSDVDPRDAAGKLLAKRRVTYALGSARPPDGAAATVEATR